MANPIEELTKRVDALEKNAHPAFDFTKLVTLVKAIAETMIDACVMGQARRGREVAIKEALAELEKPETE